MNERVSDFWTELSRTEHQHVAVITHGGAICLLLAADQQLPLASAFTIKVEYGDVVLVHPR